MFRGKAYIFSDLLRKFIKRLDGPEILPFSNEEIAQKGSGFRIAEKEFVHHTSLPEHETAAKSITGKQKLIFLAVFLFLTICFLINWRVSLQFIIAVLTFLYFGDLFFNLFLVYRSFSKKPEHEVRKSSVARLLDSDLPVYTIFCPLYKEWKVLPQFIEAMSDLDYPKDKLQIMLLLEEDDEETIRHAKEMQLPSHFEIVVVPHSKPKTKPKAMNYGLNFARGEFIVIYDAEDKPEPDQLKKAFLVFGKVDEKTVCVQAKLNFYNPNQNLLTKLFTAEYSLWFDLILPGLQSIGAPIPLGGTSNHFRTSNVKLLQGWDAFNVTEDCDLGLRLAKRGFKTAVVDSTTYEEANSNLKNWYRQRSRWIKGYMQTYLVQMRRPLELWNGFGQPHLVTLQLTVGGKILSMFVNPVMWLVTFCYFAFRSSLAPIIEPFFPGPVLVVGVFCLVFGNFLYLYFYMVGSLRRKQYGLIKYAFLVPLYWLFMSVAAWQALYEIIKKPHYWAKTVHGLHLKKENSKTQSNLWKEAAALESINRGSIFSGLQTKVSSFMKSQLPGGGFYVAALLLSNFFNFLFSAILGRRLSLEDFATVTLFNTILSILGIVFGAISSSVNFRTAFLNGQGKISEAASFSRKTQRIILLLSILASIAWFAVFPHLGQFFNVTNSSLMVLFTPVFLVGAFSSSQSGYLRGMFLFGLLGLSNIAESGSKVLFAWGLSSLGFTDYVALAIPGSILVSFALVWVFTRFSYKKELSLESKPALNKALFPSKFFFAALVNNSSTVIFLNIDVLLAKHFLSPQDAGVYALLSLVGKMVFFFGSLLSSFITSLVTRHLGANTSPQKDFYRLFNATVLITLAGFIGAGVLGQFTLPILFGANAYSVLPYVLGYCLAMSLFTFSTTIVSYHMAKREYSFSIISLFSGLLIMFGILQYHQTVGEFAQVMVVTSLVYFGAVTFWHAYKKNNWFVLRNITDFLNVFIPLSAVSEKTTGKRILIFNWRDTKHAFAGGAEVYVQELAKRWVRDGHSVTIFCGNDGKNSREELVDGVNIVRRGGFYFVYAWAFWYYLVQFRGRYDFILDCENGVPFFTPLYAKEPVYCLMHHVHQEVFHKFLPKPLAMFAAFLENSLMPWAYKNTKFVTVSNSSKKEMKNLALGKAGIEVVFPGVDLDKLVPGEKDSRPTILYLGRLQAYKSVDVLLNAFAEVLKKIPEAVLVIAGGGEKDKELRTQAKNLGLDNSVEFLGKVAEEEKIKLFQKAWVFVNPSLIEGWGITTIEANACGVPVVASNVPGLCESVNNPHTGFLFPHGDIEKMAEKIIYLLSDEESREWMGKNARQWSEQFSWDKSAKMVMGLIAK